MPRALVRSNRTLASLNNRTTVSWIKSLTSLGSLASVASSREAASESSSPSLSSLASAMTAAYCNMPASMTERRWVRPSGTSLRNMRTHTSYVSAPTTALKLRLVSFAIAFAGFLVFISTAPATLQAREGNGRVMVLKSRPVEYLFLVALGIVPRARFHVVPVRNSEFIAPAQPVMPISDGLLGFRVRCQRFQLGQRHRQVTAMPPHSNKHLGFTLLGSHTQDIHLFPDAQRRNRTLGSAAGFVFFHAGHRSSLMGLIPIYVLPRHGSLTVNPLQLRTPRPSTPTGWPKDRKSV